MRGIILIIALFFISWVGWGEETLISLDLKEADLTNVLRMIAEEYGLNIIAGKDVGGKVTVSFTNVSLENALKAILNVNGYDFARTGNIIKVFPLPEGKEITTRIYVLEYADADMVKNTVSSLLTPSGKIEIAQRKKEEKPSLLIVRDIPSNIPRLERTIKMLDTSPTGQKVITQVFPLNFVDASSLLPHVKRLLSPQGSVEAYTRKGEDNSNLLVVRDFPEVLEKVEQVVTSLDKPIPQIMIESRIMEVSLEDEKQIGISWEYMIEDVEPSREESYTTSVRLLPDIAEGTFLDYWRYNVLSEERYSLLLQLLETSTDAKVLSQPRVATMENQEAEIVVGTTYPIPTYSYNTERGTWEVTGYEEINVGVTLRVTPRIQEGGKRVILKVSPEVSEIIDWVYRTFATPEGQVKVKERPVTSTRKASTIVSVPDGYTMVIGGLIKESLITKESKVPVLGDIPLLGFLFRKHNPAEEKRDLLIFVTPRVLTDKEIKNIAEEGRERLESFYTKGKKEEEKLKKETEKESGNKGYIYKKEGEK